MTKTVKWMLAGLLVVLGAAAVVALILRGDRTGALKASVDMMNAWHKQSIDSKKAKIDELKKDYDKNKDKIDAIDSDIRKKRIDLERKYKSSGMTTDEVANRLTDLGY